MIKRVVSLFLCLMLLSTAALAAKYPKALDSNVGRSFEYTPSTRGTWVSSDPAVASVNARGIVNMLAEGEATISFTARDGKQQQLKITVGPAGEMPEIIQQGIDYALKEWEEAGNQPFPRSNKYTFWLRNAKSTFGWCGAFANYCMESVGIPANWRGESTLQPDGRAHAVHEAGVPKIWESFTKMGRIGYIPQPGYQVIYGRRGSTPYVHLGLITDVIPLGEGRYEVMTVEGNMDNRILRYRYIYDAMSPDKERNYTALPLDQQTEPDKYKYEPHNKGGWYITAFGQTWY